jgi:tetratricopeptide (TPR) repeat protein
MSRSHTAIFVMLVALGAAGPVAGQDVAATPSRDDNWKRCREADADARLTGCRAVIQSGQEKPADLARAYYYRGSAYRAKNLFDAAIEDFTESIKLDPANVDAYGDRAITLTAAGRLMDAIPDFTHVIEADPKSAYAFYDRGLCYELLGLDDLAIEDFSAAVVLTPTDAFKWERRGTLYFRKGQLDLALADYEKALTVDPQYAPALYGRGAVKMKKGDLAGGGADIAQAKHFQENVDRDMARSGVRP